MIDTEEKAIAAGYRSYQDYLSRTGGQSGGGGGGPQQVSSADLAGIRETVFNTLKPYYLQLAKEAQGDYNRAVSKLEEDYTTNTRNDKIAYAFTRNQGISDMTNTLAQLGITNLDDQRDAIDKLNQRGAAVYQNNPDGTPNALRSSDINSNTNFDVPLGSDFDSSSRIAYPANPQAMGQGGFELAQLQNKQRLQQEAQQRAITKPIQQAGITLKSQTNLPAGIDPNLPPDQLAAALAAAGIDRSTLGSEEQGLVTGKETATRNLQQTQEGLTNELGGDVTNIADQVANTTDRNSGSTLANQLVKERVNQFTTTGS